MLAYAPILPYYYYAQNYTSKIQLCRDLCECSKTLDECNVANVALAGCNVASVAIVALAGVALARCNVASVAIVALAGSMLQFILMNTKSSDSSRLKILKTKQQRLRGCMQIFHGPT